MNRVSISDMLLCQLMSFHIDIHKPHAPKRNGSVIRQRIENVLEPTHRAEELISTEKTEEGMLQLAEHLRKLLERLGLAPEDCVVIPILKGGKVVGDRLAQEVSIETTYMRMSHTDGTEWLPEPICTIKPNVEALRNKKLIVFAEAVFDTGETLIAAKKTVQEILRQDAQENGQIFNDEQVKIYSYGLVSKLKAGVQVLENQVAAFQMDSAWWIFGMGCDYNQMGRKLKKIMGFVPLRFKLNKSNLSETKFLLEKVSR